ncbi:hypothetical protein Scep_022609 [Stephania cephalantha]|uniref:UDP-N-acetylenolpyruvoylglucosamine reductase C-terminal domain-containing protein n=1 Tax=Stephania cephalantha TaxID=152367 RepID=A0AAP0I2E3_9MAGN
MKTQPYTFFFFFIPSQSLLLNMHAQKLLSDICTWGIGGPCAHFAQVSNHAQLIFIIGDNSIGFVIVGKGSNCLFDDKETSDTVDSVEIITIDGENRVFDRIDLAFGYRWSCFQEMEDLAAIVSVTFCLKASSSSRERQKDYMARRRLLQLVGERSAGSVFRNPLGVGISAGELIEKAGMKGFRVGGAKVSDKHANFFINLGSSTSRDMLELIHIVKEKVNQKFGIQLVEEIRYICPHHQSPR